MADTFASKLRQMRKDLASVVDRMNRDQSYETAAAAQQALLAVAKLEESVEEHFGDLDDFGWDWKPGDAGG